MITVRYRAALFSTILAATTFAATAAVLAVAAPASAVVPGFAVKITELPGSIAAGAAPSTVTVVASTDVGRRCQKVRWSMVLRVDGVDLGQVRVDRVEETGSFPLRIQADGDTARLTDVQLDPGELCTGSTVTARYRVAVDASADAGRVTFQAEAYDRNERLLQQASATSRVVGDRTAPSPSPSASPSPSESESAEPEESADASEPAEDAAAGADGPASPDPTGIAAVPTSSGDVPSLLGPGLIIGAVLVFLGVGLLLRLRLKARQAEVRPLHTSFYPSHQ
jgi:hypothetical protein